MKGHPIPSPSTEEIVMSVVKRWAGDPLLSRPFNNRMGIRPANPARERASQTVAEIMIEVAAKHGLTPAQILGDQRPRKIAAARHEIMYRASKEALASLTVIGKVLRKDHTSVKHGIKKYEERVGQINGAAG
jgi:chromosomal replication initiation ATPase DnaA